MPKPTECPMCHSTRLSDVNNDKFDDMYYCEACEHRFRYGNEVDNTIK